jgi:protein O-GlcNAc transferase
MTSVRQALNLAWEHFQKGRWEQAEQLYLRVLEVDPRQIDALQLMAVIAGRTGRYERAIEFLEVVLRLQPGSAEAHHNLGNALLAQGKLTAAAASLETAVSLKPDYAVAHNSLGNVLRDLGRLEEAVACFGSARTLEPASAHFHSNLILTLNYDPRCDARGVHEECARWNQQHAEPLEQGIRPHTNRPDPERRLRIGYVSPHFGEHVDSFFTIPLLSNHDHTRFEIFCYAGQARPDVLTERIKGYADAWRDTARLTDQDLADLVRSDQIDVLVDLEMHMSQNRLLVFARKPAPVQVAWLAYPGTTGLTAIDYRLTDPYLDPPGLFDAFYAEQSVRLPETFWCYDPLSDQPHVNPLPATANGVITFGSLNHVSKLNDGCLELWARVLAAVRESRMLVQVPQREARSRVLAKLEKGGIAASRVEFADRLPRQEYLALYHRIDVALDPVPCNGHTTTLDAFWMGVPTLSLVANRVVGRAGLSQLSNLGLHELAAETPEAFVALAGQFTGNLARLQELRSTLRRRMLNSPLMDGKRFGRGVEDAYRQMWNRWCEDQQGREPG